MAKESSKTMSLSGSQDIKVSIIIPYNKDRGWLGEAVASANAQVFDSFEVIIQQGDYTLGKNINDALKKAKGKWIKILAEDDLLPANAINDLYNETIKGYDFVCGNAVHFGDPEYLGNGETIYHFKKTTLQQMILRNDIHGGTVLYNKDVLFKVGGFDESLWTAEEYDMNLCLLANGYRLGYCDSIVYYYRLHEKNKSYYMSYMAKANRTKYINEIKKRYYKYVF